MNPENSANTTGDLESLSPEQLLSWAVKHFENKKLALVSAFGPGTCVIIDMLAGIKPDLPVIFIDTLHHFPETLQHVERMVDRYKLNLHVYSPAPNLEAFEARYGPRLWERDLDRYQQVAKVEPFEAATAHLDAWITGRRQDQSSTRTDLLAVETGAKTRINPLTSWNRSQLWRYIHDHKVPYNPLLDQGYKSIGDMPLTTTVGEGEDERAGRWRNAGRLECGIHEIPLSEREPN